MQNHKVKVAIPYAALEPLGISLLEAGQVDLASICVLFDTQIVAIYDRQAPNYGVSAEIDPDTKKITAEVVSLNMM